ncbi:Lrp/AsnC family transcriptional regulator [Leadbetterella byssophila]|jgi:DNA-binding Lrp family transcriptional regulator|uniref:Transcriptional regulator, AsnC family n=1 Tax=Leadbetterella byssophila (strain DSM 17132 / JCM 16389 / KACC 11308 / NBRC 106382 / 4M15) TaxID=649349 RepID=E4RY09_LEAB4|nr:Lrp/AsnC ligand binding domain-containing protein [Leadbetterella byssophila]ADQ16337.1 transcriptional regulator, AsnC family [Leadbetterella byssophila DSM 17132]
MVTAVILFSVERSHINAVGEELAGTKGITEVFSVSGQYDLVALARVQKNEDLADLMTKTIGNLPGIIKTETLIAFRTLSKYDLESMFDLGS